MRPLRRDRRDEEFTAFVDEHGSALLRAAQFLTADRWHAEDLLQTALTKVYLAWPSARGHSSYAYARKALTTTYIDSWRRRRWREYAADHTDLTATSNPTLDDHAQAVAERDALDQALARLTPRERVVLVLRYCEDLTEKDTARLLGVSTGTVKTLTFRALAKLRIDPALALPHRDSKEPNRVGH